MEETCRLLIEFKTIHPFRFWFAIFIMSFIIIFAIWKILNKKQKSKNEQVVKQSTTSTAIVEKEITKPKIKTNKEKTKLEKSQTGTSIKIELELNELKATENKQENVIQKVETFVVKTKTEEQLPKVKEEKTKSNEETLGQR